MAERPAGPRDVALPDPPAAPPGARRALDPLAPAAPGALIPALLPVTRLCRPPVAERPSDAPAAPVAPAPVARRGAPPLAVVPAPRRGAAACSEASPPAAAPPIGALAEPALADALSPAPRRVDCPADSSIRRLLAMSSSCPLCVDVPWCLDAGMRGKRRTVGDGHPAGRTLARGATRANLPPSGSRSTPPGSHDSMSSSAHAPQRVCSFCGAPLETSASVCLECGRVHPLTAAPGAPLAVTSERRILPAALLCLLFGVFGAHRFYAGKIGTGVLQLLTLGGLGIWMLADLILLLTGQFKDREGARIREWM